MESRNPKERLLLSLDDLEQQRIGVSCEYFVEIFIKETFFSNYNFLYCCNQYLRAVVEKELESFKSRLERKQIRFVFVLAGIKPSSASEPSNQYEIRNMIGNLIKAKSQKEFSYEFNQNERNTLLKSQMQIITQAISQSQYLISNKEIEYIVAPFSAEAQLIQMFKQQLISLLFVSPDSIRKYLTLNKMNSLILCAIKLQREPSQYKQIQDYYLLVEEVTQYNNKSNQPFIQQLHNDYLCSCIKFESAQNLFSIKSSRLSQFAIFCITVGLIRPSFVSIFQTHILNFWNKLFKINQEQFLFGLVAQRYSRLFKYGEKIFFSTIKTQPLQDFFYVKHANQQQKKHSNQNGQQMNEIIRLNSCQNQQANKGRQTILQIICGFQKQLNLQSSQLAIQSCNDLLSQLNWKSTLDLVYVMNYINPKQKNSLLYEKLLIEIENQMSNPQFNFEGGAITILLLELLHFGYLSDLNLDQGEDDQLQIEPEITQNKKNIVLISRIFCISHNFFPKSKLTMLKYLDSDLMKYCYLLQQLKENLETVRQVTFCTAFYKCLQSGKIGLNLRSQDTIDQIKLLEDSLIKPLEVNSQVGLSMKILLLQYHEQNLKTELKLDFDQELKKSIKFVYYNVWKRLIILFKKLQNFIKLKDSYLSLIQSSDKILEQFLQHQTII